MRLIHPIKILESSAKSQNVRVISNNKNLIYTLLTILAVFLTSLVIKLVKHSQKERFIKASIAKS